MKKFYSFLVAFIATTSLSFGQWTSFPVYESFNYAEGNLGLSTATAAYPWNYGSTKSAQVVAGPNLMYSGMTTTQNKVIKLVNTGSTVNIKTLFPTQNDPVYASFLFQVLSMPIAESTRIISFVGTANSGSLTFSPGIYINQSGTNFKLGFDAAAYATSSQSSELYLNTTYMVIMKYTPSSITAGGSADFWINPTSTSSPTVPDFSFSTGGVISNVNGVTLRTGIDAADVLLDELHISTSWADVAPSSISTGIENTSQKSFSLSTTILKDQISITDCNEKVNVNFYTPDFKLIKSVRVTEGNSIDVSNLSKGIYFIKISSNSKSSIVKAIKK